MPEPFYVYFPSVRPLVARTLSHWFTQALEAKADENVLDKLVKAAQTQPDRDTKKMLAKMRGRLQNRKLLGNIKVSNEVHLIVTDSSLFYSGKPWEETHGPQVRDLATELNKIGNRFGVFVHYISGPQMLSTYNPKDNGFLADAVFHQGRKGPLVSPNGGANFTLQYIQADAVSRNASKVHAVKIDDDMVPAWRDGKRGAANYFLKMVQSAEGPAPQQHRFSRYGGFQYGLDRPVRFRFDEIEKKRGTDTFHSAIFSGRAANFLTFATRFSQYYPTNQNMKVTALPEGLLHLGGKSTYPWSGKHAFFGRHEGFYGLRPLPQELALEIRKESGIVEKRPKP